jgi:hypothetical protein
MMGVLPQETAPALTDSAGITLYLLCAASR